MDVEAKTCKLYAASECVLDLVLANPTTIYQRFGCTVNLSTHFNT